MQRPFRFRYTSEIAGGFVILAVVLLVAGIFVAGHAQGWFERRFRVVTVFKTEEGAFGLQEDSEVRIRNTKAGRVVRITPTADGQIKATFELKNRFRPFVRTDSVAKVGKKFGVTGDSFVEIVMGKGEPVADGAVIESRKDEEIMETARKALKDIQSVVVPMLDEVQGILKNVNGIVGNINKGEGVAGAVVTDKKLAGDVKDVVFNVNGLLLNSQEAVREITRLIKGAQKHWLVKKYIGEIKDTEFVAPVQFSESEVNDALKKYRAALDSARAANDSGEICRNAYNLAMCMLVAQDYRNAAGILAEARMEAAGVGGEHAIRVVMLEAELLRRTGTAEQAIEAATRAVALLDRKSSPEIAMNARLILADIYCDLNKPIEASEQVKTIKSVLKKTESSDIKATEAKVRGRIAATEGNPAVAAQCFDRAAEILRDIPAHSAMSDMLNDAGREYARSGMQLMAADRYFRSGRVMYVLGQTNAAERAFGMARTAASLSGDGSYAKDLNLLCQQIADSHVSKTKAVSADKR